MKVMHRIVAASLALLLMTGNSFGFCGFYVSKAPASLFNHKSEVIFVRDGDHCVITMSNDFQADVNDFAMVIPVPVVLREDQIRVVDRGIFDRLDAYSAPRLVEYYDPNPCEPIRYEMNKDLALQSAAERSAMPAEARMEDESYNVKIEAKYSIGEYDMMILSATESDGLMRWLNDNGYKVPIKATEVLEPYIKNNTKFFVAKVNIERHLNSGFTFLNPIQVDFHSNKFELPIRLGMANAENEQDLIIYTFSKNGRVEPVNYRSVKIPSDRNVPLFVESYFGDFYSDLFSRAYYREGMNAVFLEYAWNVSPTAGVKCDPCVSPPPVFDDFAKAGVDWVSGMNSQSQVYFTRMHVRYTRNKFPQDLQFLVTPNTENFQARYILHHPAQGDWSCSEGSYYRQQLEYRRSLEVAELQTLAGWTNPNYTDYIKEYSQLNKPDKYAPNRNQFIPVDNSNDIPKPPVKGKLIFMLCGLFGVWFLWILRKRSLNFEMR